MTNPSIRAGLLVALLLPVALPAVAAGGSTAPAVTAATTGGAALTGTDGLPLYVFDKEKDGTPVCYDHCAKRFPPFLGKQGESRGPDWTLVARKDGSLQWAYKGRPAYFYRMDRKNGTRDGGDGYNGKWHLLQP